MAKYGLHPPHPGLSKVYPASAGNPRSAGLPPPTVPIVPKFNDLKAGSPIMQSVYALFNAPRGKAPK
jgi:hypothetical protein